MNLGPVEDGPELKNPDRAYILHEFGHALGFLHEHQSPTMEGQLKKDCK